MTPAPEANHRGHCLIVSVRIKFSAADVALSGTDVFPVLSEKC